MVGAWWAQLCYLGCRTRAGGQANDEELVAKELGAAVESCRVKYHAAGLWPACSNPSCR